MIKVVLIISDSLTIFLNFECTVAHHYFDHVGKQKSNTTEDIKNLEKDKPKILFICLQNSNLSTCGNFLLKINDKDNFVTDIIDNFI